MSELEALRARIRALETKGSKPARDGRDGTDGVDGRDADPAFVAAEVRRQVRAAIEAMPRAVDGRDADPELIRQAVEEAVEAIPKPRDGVDGQMPTVEQLRELIDVGIAAARAEFAAPVDGKDGPRGPRGPRGEKGDAGPMGPMPRHEYDGTRIRFEIDIDFWGEWHDIGGPPGKARVLYGGGGTAKRNSYFPGGWGG